MKASVITRSSSLILTHVSHVKLWRTNQTGPFDQSVGLKNSAGSAFSAAQDFLPEKKKEEKDGLASEKRNVEDDPAKKPTLGHYYLKFNLSSVVFALNTFITIIQCPLQPLLFGKYQSAASSPTQ